MDFQFLIGAEVITKSCYHGPVESVSGTDITIFIPETGERKTYRCSRSDAGALYDKNFVYIKNPVLRNRLAKMIREDEIDRELRNLLFDD